MDRGWCDLEHRGRSDEMAHFVGLDVSVKETSVCVVDDTGKVILEQKVATEPADIIALLTSLGVTYGRIGIEAGPLSQWLVNALTAAELPVICVETRHMNDIISQIDLCERLMNSESTCPSSNCIVAAWTGPGYSSSGLPPDRAPLVPAARKGARWKCRAA
jgi:hypothetical protein